MRKTALLLCAGFLMTPCYLNADTNPLQADWAKQCVARGQLDLTQANTNNSGIRAWATEATYRIYTLDFMNVKKQLQYSSDYFTPDAWTSYLKAFTKSGNLSLLQTRQMASSATVTNSPVIEKQGVVSGAYTWQVTLPVTVIYATPESKLKQEITLHLTLQRTNPFVGQRGIAISNIIAKQIPSDKPAPSKKK